MLRIIAVIICLLGETMPVAFNTVQLANNFDPSSDGGNWTCFRSLASGTCGAGPFFQYLDAPCDGSSSDNTALGSWLTYGSGLGATLAKLYIPPGSQCVLGGSNGTSFAANVATTCAGFGGGSVVVIQNLLVWAYGASVNDPHWFGGRGVWNDRSPNGVETGCTTAPTNTSPLINSVSAGATSVVLSTAAERSNFVVNDWIIVTGLATQPSGFPPNTFYHEHAQIMAIASDGTLSLDRALQNSYLSTWPDIAPGTTSPWRGGPASVYLLEKTYPVTATYKGLIVNGTSLSNIIGKNITLQGVVWATVGTNGPNPTQAETISINGGYFPATEIDKLVDTLTITGTRGVNLTIQSSSVNTFTIQNSVFSGTMTGSTRTTSLAGSSFGSIKAGPTCCGVQLSMTLFDVTFTTAAANYHKASISDYSFAAGTLTISKASGGYTNGIAQGLWVPGAKYFMGDTDGSNTCSPANTFTVSAVVEAGANVQIVTNIPSIPVTNICNSNTRPPSTFGAYQTQTLSVTNSGPGNLQSNPEMVAP